MSFCFPEKQSSVNLEDWVLLVKLEKKLKLLKLSKCDKNDIYLQHKLIYPNIEENNIHCFNLPFLNISMLSTKYSNYDKLVTSLNEMTNLQDLMKNNNNYNSEEIALLKKETMNDEVPPANHYDNVMEMKDFDNKFLDSNKKTYYVYLNNDTFNAYLLDTELEMSYFPELKNVSTLELDLNLYNKYKDMLDNSLFYNENQVMNVVGSGNLSFSNLNERFNLLFEKDSDNEMTFDDILNNLIVNIDEVLNDKRMLSFYKASLRKILEINQVEKNTYLYLYLVKLKHSDNILSAKNLLKINENNTEAMSVDVFNEKLETLKGEYINNN